MQDQAAAGKHRRGAFAQTQAGQIRPAELPQHHGLVLLPGEQAAAAGLHGASDPLLQRRRQLLPLRGLRLQQRLRRGKAPQLVDDLLQSRLALSIRGVKGAGGDVAEGHGPAVLRGGHAGDIVVPSLLQHGALRDGAGGDDPGDLPFHQALGQGRILHLLADGHIVSLGNQSGDVSLAAVIGHAAHGHLILRGLVPVPGGQGQIQLFGGQLGVLQKHLVKVAQPEEQDAILVLFLDFQILLHHGGDLRHAQSSFSSPSRLHVVLPVMVTFRNDPIHSAGPFSRTSRPPSVRAVRCSPSVPSTSTRKVRPT